MRYGVEIVPFGDYADPRLVVKLAQAAESVGWEGLFLWDHLAFVLGFPSGDPWVTLAAVAQATERLIIGTTVTPIPRRRPHTLAHALATLDLLSEGRVVLGAGLGSVEREFSAFGESDDARHRAALLDEGLTVIDRLWSGDSVTHHGEHFTVDQVTLAPLPLQRPRIPIWIGGESRPALRRAARWDGWVIPGINEAGERIRSPEQMAESLANIARHRAYRGRFDVALTGYTKPSDRTLTQAYADAGVTWWLESLNGLRGSFDELMERVKSGPPD